VKTICLLLVTLFILPHLSLADEASDLNAPRLISSDASGIVVEVGVQTYSLSEVQVQGQAFRRMTVPGYVTTVAPGRPAVPVTSALLGVPENVDLSVAVLEEEGETLTGVRLAPFSDPGLRPGIPEVDERAYQSDMPYPSVAAEIASVAYLRHQRVAVLALRPVRYNAGRGELRVASRLRVAVRFLPRGAPKPVRLPDPEGDRAFEPVYRAALLNADSARPWRVVGPPARAGLGKVDLRGTWYRPAWTYYRFPIQEDGVYRMDLGWFAAAGLDTARLDLTRLKLYLDGEEVPLRVSDGGDSRLNAGDYVEFYGRYRRAEGRDFENSLGRENVFYLTQDGEAGKRVVDVDATPRNGYAAATSYRAAFHVERDSLYDPLGFAPDNLRDHWYWARIDGPASRSFDFAMDGMDRASLRPVALRVTLHGLSDLTNVDPDHRALLRLNGATSLGEAIWEGQTEYVVNREMPLSAFREGINALSVEVPSETAPGAKDLILDLVLFNSLDVTYDRLFRAVDEGLTFDLENFAEGRRISVSGLKGPEVVVYDVARGARLAGVEVRAEGEGVRATFEVGANRAGRYVVAGANQIRRPGPARRRVGMDLRGDRTGADYLILTHGDFRDALIPLVQRRQASGLSVKVVDVEDVYEAFGFGQFEPEAVRAYLRHLMAAWSRPPAYLLLVGRETYDYRDILRTGRKSYVPALYFQSRQRGNAPTDFLYAAVVGDDLFPDLSVGRLSVSTPEEAATAVRKVVAYDAPPAGRWRDRGLFLANREDFLRGPNDHLIQTYSGPFGLEAIRLYSDDRVPEPNENTRRFIELMNDGNVLVNFSGHGSIASMAYFFRGTSQQETYTYITRVVNGERLPFFIAMSCLNGMYAEPTMTSLAEEMVNKPDGGAVAYVSASALGFVFSDSLLNDRMFLHAFRRGERGFGRLLDLAKIDMIKEFPAVDYAAMTMNLIGDPAQRLALLDRPDYAAFADSVFAGDAPIAQATLLEGDSARVVARLLNLGVLSQTSVRATLLDRWQGRVDTLFSGMLPPFGQTDSLAVVWPLTGRAGPHQLSLTLDAGAAEELDRTNNALSIPLTVYPSQVPVPLGPLDDQRLASPDVTLSVLNATSGGLRYAFEVSPSLSFDGPGVRRSGPLPEEARITTWTATGLSPGVYFWRAQAVEAVAPGRWSGVRAFLVDPSAGRETWRQGAAAQLSRNRLDGVTLSDGALTRLRRPRPARLDSTGREALVRTEGTSGAGVLCTDGKYLYVKRWYGGTSTIYPGTDVFRRVGTGLEGTVAGRDYGAFPGASAPGVSATYHSDGFIYNDVGKAHELERIDPNTGRSDRVRIPAGLLEQESGLVADGQFLIASDGRYIYNLASGVDGVRRAAWKARVFDPAQGWAVAREFVIPPTSNGFTYLTTDGLIADGDYLYLVEFTTSGRGRVRVVSAQDGAFVEERLSDQPETGIITGQYDWRNNRVWLGKLLGPLAVRYAGKSIPPVGTAETADIGPAARWGTLSVTIVDPPSGPTPGASVEIGVLGQRIPSGPFEPIPNFSALPASPGIDLSPIDAATYRRIRLVARFRAGGLQPSPGLRAWGLDYTPLPTVTLSNLGADRTEVKELEPIRLSAQVLNLGPTEDLSGAVVAFYAGSPYAGGRLIGRAAIPSVRVGETVVASLTWDTKRFGGMHRVHARAEAAGTFADLGAEAAVSPSSITVVGSGDVTPPRVEVRSLDASGTVRPDDFLPSRPRFEVTVSDPGGVDRASVRIRADEKDIPLASPEVTGLTETATEVRFTFTPTLADGRHTIRVEAKDRFDNGPASASVAFVVTSDLRIASPLVFPNPVTRDAHFTYLLSQPARVSIRVYSVAGHLVRRIEDAPGAPGYNQVQWDGLDQDGAPLGNGAYLYVISARGADQTATARERLIVLRR